MTFSVQGAWTRQSVSLDGGQPFETQHVYWLQAGDCYADVRVPFHPAGGTSCFCGRSDWDGDRFRWTHRLDMGEPAGDDIGELRWEGDRLIETGMLGAVAYEEVWVRLPATGTESSEVLEGPRCCHVRVGGHQIEVVDSRPDGGSFGARYRIGDVIGEIGGGVSDIGCVHTHNPTRLVGQAR